jgi:hypothetical protein
MDHSTTQESAPFKFNRVLEIPHRQKGLVPRVGETIIVNDRDCMVTAIKEMAAHPTLTQYQAELETHYEDAQY